MRTYHQAFWYAYIHDCVYRHALVLLVGQSADGLNRQSLPSTVFKVGSFVVRLCLHQDSWPVSLQGLSWMPPILQEHRNYSHAQLASFYVDAGDLTSGPHVCTANSVLIEPSFQLAFSFMHNLLYRSCSRVSVTVIKHHHQKQLMKEGIYLAYTSHLCPLLKDRNSRKLEQELKQWLWRSSACFLVPHGLLTLLPIQSRATCPGGSPSIVSWTLLH